MIYDARYGQPQEVVFDGLLYLITAIPPQQLLVDGTAFSQATVPTREDESDVHGDEGHPFLIFNLAVYQKTDVDPALIPDNILRTVAFPTQDKGPDRSPNTRVHNRHYPWTLKQHNKLFQLLEEATCAKKKELAHKDFDGITKALHDVFRGDHVPIGEQLTFKGPDFTTIRINQTEHTYPERSFNAVHSYVTKTCKDEYAALVAQVLSSLERGD